MIIGSSFTSAAVIRSPVVANQSIFMLGLKWVEFSYAATYNIASMIHSAQAR